MITMEMEHRIIAIQIIRYVRSWVIALLHRHHALLEIESVSWREVIALCLT
jgi:hypothetical protein